MERELVELFEAAKKAAEAASADRESLSGGPKVDRCLDVLNQLKNYAVTYDVLVSTQVWVPICYSVLNLFKVRFFSLMQSY